jgi:hypothetical protein
MSLLPGSISLVLPNSRLFPLPYHITLLAFLLFLLLFAPFLPALRDPRLQEEACPEAIGLSPLCFRSLSLLVLFSLQQPT